MVARGTGLTFGRYLLGERLGVGGMGEVFLAVQTGIGRFEKPLALKLLLPHLSSRARAVRMFLDEARLAARMNHPNVTSIFDVGVVDGRYFMAMELVQGISLSRLIDALKERNEAPDEGLLAAVGAALCDGLHHAHEQRGSDGRPLGLVHRDVTPQNVLISLDGVVKLADFGIARANDTLEDSAQPRLLGKLAYLPPEQLDGKPVDRRADLYAAGLTLLHFATLAQPLERATREATLAAILKGHPAGTDGVPEAMRRAIDAALVRDPAGRPPDARSLRAMLPPVPSDASARLGALVQGAFAEELRTLSAHTNHTLELGKQTGSVSPIGPGRDAIETQDVAGLRRGDRRPLAWGLGAAVVTAVAVVAAMLMGVSEAKPGAPQAPLVPTVAPSISYLTVDADPWAQVYVGGKLLGETPMSLFPVESGEVVVELRNPETHRTVSKALHLAPGEKAVIKERLR